MDYFDLKSLHIFLALTSISGFVIRWVWMKSGSRFSQHKLTLILPHLIDTLFFASGIWLAWTIQQYPFVHGWLTAKILGLMAYIILGSLALKHAKSPRGRNLAFIAALVVLVWIITVARSKNALGFLSF